MTLAALTPEEREVVRRAMAATFSYFALDFQPRLGITPQEMGALLDAWPDVDDSGDESDACLAINNSLKDLLHGEGISEEEAMALVGVPRAEMLRVYRKWAAARRWKSSRLARECTKLDPKAEQALADEGLAEDFREWPE